MTGRSDTPYFDKLYDLTKEKTLAYITAKCGNISDVQDIFQETYAEVYSVICKKGESYVRNEVNFTIEVAKKKLARFYGRRRIITLPLENENEEPIDIPDEINVEDSIADKEMIRLVSKRLSEMPLDIQKIFHLRFYLDMKLSDIAYLMEMSETNVKHKLYRTIKEMRTYFTGEVN